MGSIYLPLADILSDAGLVVRVTSTNSGWEKRARSSGGYSAMPVGVMWHHAASSTSTSDEACCNYQVRVNQDAPVGNFMLGRNGDAWPVAGGASNCSGKGGPMTFSRGVCPKDSGNTSLVNIEVNNSGVGEPWSTALIDAYFKASNAMNAYCGNQPEDITSHALGKGNGYTDRKIDPATASAVQGPWRPRSTNSSGTWDLDDMRSEARARATPPPPSEGWIMTPRNTRIYDSRQAGGRFKAGTSRRIAVPEPATQALVHMVAVNPAGPGLFIVGGVQKPNTSAVNYGAPGSTGECLCYTGVDPDGTFQVWCDVADADLVIDLQGVG